MGHLIWKDCKSIRKGGDTWQHILVGVGTVIVLVFGWLTLDRVQFASKHIRVVLLLGRIFGLPTSENFDTTNWKITPGAIWPGVQGLSKSLNCDRTQATVLVEVRPRDGSSGQKDHDSSSPFLAQG